VEATTGISTRTGTHEGLGTRSLTGGARWLIGTAVLCLFAIYLIGIDQGATSLFGHGAGIHEFVHDARHFLGFPCH
jgi:hypothetical protein